MKSISSEVLHKAIYDMIIKSNRTIRDDVLKAFHECQQNETTAVAKEIFRQLIENAEYAQESGLALCQDCGAAVFFVEHGEDVRIEDDTLISTINKAMVDAYDKGSLRKSICHPFTRKNTGDNTPAMIHVELVPGDAIRIRYMAKGGGSENMSRATMLSPSQGWSGIKEFVIKRIAESGPNPCPPVIVGVGVGGTFDVVPTLAKKALFRPIPQYNSDPDIANMEKELFTAINALGIGPMGLGGKNTCLAVKMEIMPCHIASLPLAVNVQCHSSRHAEVVL